VTWRILLAAAVTAFASALSALSVLKHVAFNTGRFDLGNMTQAVWATAHGDPLEVTNLRGEQMTRLGAHFDPILAAFAPLWWLWPHPSLLLVAQVIAVAAGAVPVFLLARKHLASERAGLGFALAYLLHPATQWMTLSEFHPVALATPLLLAAFWYLDEDRLLPFALVVAAACLTKEHVGFAVAMLGVWYWLARRRRRAGLAIAAAGVATSAFAVAVAVPHFSPRGVSAFEGRYAAVGGGPVGILETVVRDPLKVLRVAFDDRTLPYLLDLLLPLLALPLLAPLALLPAFPELAANLLSSARTQQSIHFHYTATLIPSLVVAALFGAKRLRRQGWTAAAATAVVVVALAANYLRGPLPVWRAFPGAETVSARAYEVTAHDRVAARAVRLVPSDAIVSATNSLGAHLSERRRILSFPVLEDAEWVAVDETRPGYRDRIAPLPVASRVRELRADPAWRVVFDEDGVVLFRRRSV
jgi:uncharacterized membrane protein